MIYGNDDRVNISTLPQTDRWSKIARSTVMLVARPNVHFDAGDSSIARISTQSLKNKYDLCANDPFQEEAVAGYCTGFLAAPDLIVTAGHCVNSDAVCHNTYFIFDYSGMASSGVVTANLSDVYSCDSIVHTENNASSGRDFAVLKLDRPVTDRTPLQLARADNVAERDTLTSIGYPHGGPAKLIQGSQVRRNESFDAFFVANIDGFDGSSGSPVFSKTGVVQGIIVRGEESYHDRGTCLEAVQCADDGCRGEDVLKSIEFREFVKGR